MMEPDDLSDDPAPWAIGCAVLLLAAVALFIVAAAITVIVVTLRA